MENILAMSVSLLSPLALACLTLKACAFCKLSILCLMRSLSSSYLSVNFFTMLSASDPTLLLLSSMADFMSSSPRALESLAWRSLHFMLDLAMTPSILPSSIASELRRSPPSFVNSPIFIFAFLSSSFARSYSAVTIPAPEEDALGVICFFFGLALGLALSVTTFDLKVESSLSAFASLEARTKESATSLGVDTLGDRAGVRTRMDELVSGGENGGGIEPGFEIGGD
mmetsp:Transcript_13710/g.28019  ORF Transcript_13710/g.28019 Transcript_13710/m.28019 type:complete len:227 (+) Transcript_13710:671-1351(+)